MRRKATALRWIATGNANTISNARENGLFMVITRKERPTKFPAGVGLGKAGAKRLGQMLKRVIMDQVESTGTWKASMPKTPFSLLRYQIQTMSKNAPKTDSANLTPVDVDQLILNMVSQYKHQGGMSMVELKQALAAGGYDVTKKNRRVKTETQRLVNNDPLIRTTRSVTFRLNSEENQKQSDTKQVRTSTEKSPKPKEDPEQRKATSRSSKGSENSQRPAIKTPRAKGKISQTAKSHKPRTTRKIAKASREER